MVSYVLYANIIAVATSFAKAYKLTSMQCAIVGKTSSQIYCTLDINLSVCCEHHMSCQCTADTNCGVRILKNLGSADANSDVQGK